ncbi:glycosyltransferase family 2 protein [Candidatus Bathyarchaeota archaeon A05DMB-2]|nr:glycosyltransferase family 2 protein [Candidatus Bathyarchaeota archaeon A05DMB-2]
MIVEVLEIAFLFCTLLIVTYLVRHYIFTIAVLRKDKKTAKPNAVLAVNYEPTVSVLIPARDEEMVIGRLLQRTTQLTYPRDKLQVVVIDDASSDGTGQIAEEFAKRYGFIEVLHRDKKTGGKGKAAALNAGLKRSVGEIVFCFDADYYPQRDIVEKLVKEFVDPAVGAVQGRPVVLNEAQNIVTRLVTLERIGGYRVDQEAREQLGLIPQFGGTVGGFRRSIVAEFGGFDESMLTEDTDLTFTIYLAGYKIRYAGDAECYEEAVDGWKAYWRQRHRWARGHMQVCFKHAFNVVRSRKLNLKAKIDGLLLLNMYFVPVVTLVAFLVGVSLILSGASQLFSALWLFVPVSFYSLAGNFAPFFEIGVGAYLDGRTRIQFLIPLLFLAYMYNIFICTKALLDLFAAKLLGKKQVNWAKTRHFGDRNCYIMN